MFAPLVLDTGAKHWGSYTSTISAGATKPPFCCFLCTVNLKPAAPYFKTQADSNSEEPGSRRPMEYFHVDGNYCQPSVVSEHNKHPRAGEECDIIPLYDLLGGGLAALKFYNHCFIKRWVILLRSDHVVLAALQQHRLLLDESMVAEPQGSHPVFRKVVHRNCSRIPHPRTDFCCVRTLQERQTKTGCTRRGCYSQEVYHCLVTCFTVGETVKPEPVGPVATALFIVTPITPYPFHPALDFLG